MEIKLYNIKDDKRAVHKNTVDTGAGTNLVATLTGSIKDDCSITDPIIEVSYNASLMTANYMYIAAFNRYYFIENITVSTQRLIISAHVDVLNSYRVDILKLTCIIERQQHEANADQYLNDYAYRSEARFNIRTVPFPHGFSKASASYVLTTGGTS